MRATFERRETRPDVAVLDDVRETLKGRTWQQDWATMLRDKAVRTPSTLPEAVARFVRFVRPLVLALEGGAPPSRWPPAGPWTK